MGGDEKGYKLDLAFARSTLQEVLVHVYGQGRTMFSLLLLK